MISDFSCEPVAAPTELDLGCAAERHSMPRLSAGASPSHLPAAQESANCVIIPASSSLAMRGSLFLRFQILADLMAFGASGFAPTFVIHSMLAATAVFTATCW